MSQQPQLIGEVKISALPLAGPVNDADLFAGVQAGTTVKQTAAAIKTYMQSKLTSAAQEVYVSDNGVNSPGRGFVNNPYASLDYAISQITDNSSAKPYLITTLSNVNIANLNLKPDVLVDLNGFSLTVTGSVTLDAGWSAGGILKIANANFVSLPALVQLDFSVSACPFALVNIADLKLIASATTIIVTSNPTGSVNLSASDNFGVSSEFAWVINNCYGTIAGGASTAITVTHDSETAGGSFSVENLTEIGNIDVASYTASGFTFNHTNCEVTGFATYRALGSGMVDVITKGMTYFNVPTIDNGTSGGTLNFLFDVIDGIPTLLNGAVFTPTAIGDGVSANQYFTPVNYTPVAGAWPVGSVVGNLAGIDAALADGGDVTLQGAYNNGTPGAQGSILLTADNLNPLATFNAYNAGNQEQITVINSATSSPTLWGYGFRAVNSSSNYRDFAHIYANVENNLAGGETGSLGLYTASFGTLTQALFMDGANQLTTSTWPMNIQNGAKTFQSTILVTGDITYDGTQRGAVLVTDNLSNHNITIPAVSFSTNADDSFTVQTTATQTLTLVPSGGTTINGSSSNITIISGTRATMQLYDPIAHSWVLTYETTIPNHQASGSFAQVITPVSNCNTAVGIKCFYSCANAVVGGVVNVTSAFTFNATNTSIVLTLGNPILSNFLSIGKAAGVGTVYVTAGANTGDGLVYDIDTTSGFNSVDVKLIVAVGSGNKTCEVSYQYLLV